MAVLGRELFSKERLNNLENIIRLNAENGSPKEYEIIIDNFKVIQRTSNPEAFGNYEQCIFEDSKIMEVVFYHGISNNNDRYIFAFKDEYLTPGNGLNGFDVNKQISERLEKTKKEWELSKLKEENEFLKEEVETLEKQVDELQAENKKMVDSKSPLVGFLGGVGASVIENLVLNNPRLISTVPGLAGLLGDNNPQPASEIQPEPEISIKKSSSLTGYQLSEGEKAAIHFVDQLKTQFGKTDFDKIIEILEKLAHDKNGIDKVLELLNS